MRPLSIIEGRDSDVIPLIINIHAPSITNLKILDCTYNTGKMWKNTQFQPLRLDIDTKLEVDVFGDFTSLPFINEVFDVIVFDPPHLPTHAASPNSSQIYKTHYGITDDDPLRDGDNITPLFEPFLKEAKRILKPKGIILAKLIDLVHNHQYQWHHIDFINCVKKIGLTPCDLVIKSDPMSANLKSSKWENVFHFRRKHTYWIIVRKGSCEAK